MDSFQRLAVASGTIAFIGRRMHDNGHRRLCRFLRRPVKGSGFDEDRPGPFDSSRCLRGNPCPSKGPGGLPTWAMAIRFAAEVLPKLRRLGAGAPYQMRSTATYDTTARVVATCKS